MKANSKPNSILFIELFTEIEQRLKTICRDQYHSTFSELLRKASKLNEVARQYSADLKEFAQLRNAIIHTRRRNYIIAEPHSDVIDDIKHIHRLLHHPPKVSEIMVTNPYSAEPNQPLMDVLRTFADKGIMRCPVIERDTIIGLITAKTLSMWLAKTLAKEPVAPDTTKVRALLPYANNNDYTIVSRRSDIISLSGHIKNSLNEGSYIQAVLVTEKGTADSKLVGIISPSDLPRLYDKIRLNS